MKKILQISNYYPPDIGGIEKIAYAISQSINRNYCERVICFTHKKNTTISHLHNTMIIRCGTDLKLASQQLSLKMSQLMKYCFIEYNPDIVIIHAPNPFLEFLLLKYLKSNIKLVVYWHSDIVKQKIGKPMFHYLTIKLLKRADAIVATSPNYIEGSSYLSLFKEKCHVIPNCIDEIDLKITKESKELSEIIREKNREKVICLGIGRQVPYKGFECLVQAFSRISDKYILYLIGREGESSQFINKVAANNNNIILLGEVDKNTLHAYLLACDIFCFPSITKNEAFGIALAEGMYFGKPVITFTIPGSGVNYVSIHNNTGIEVENSNIQKYLEAIIQLGENKKMREFMGNNAKKRVCELFTLTKFQNNILEMLNQLY